MILKDNKIEKLKLYTIWKIQMWTQFNPLLIECTGVKCCTHTTILLYDNILRKGLYLSILPSLMGKIEQIRLSWFYKTTHVEEIKTELKI